MAFKTFAEITPSPETGEYTLRHDLVYYSARMKELITVKAPFRSNGASIPRLLHTPIGTPFDPRWIAEAFLHDYLCREGIYPREICDLIFLDALSENKWVSDTRAQSFYRAVRIGSLYMVDRYKERQRGKELSVQE